ncbi:MAG: hypothetical protein Q8L86_16315 [Vicinamibacterales bacterium]|nr:hypothetical protein [Vicinamibacterales bacterium]
MTMPARLRLSEDAAVLHQVAGSATGRMAGAAVDALTRAWRGSRARAVLGPVMADTPADQARTAARVALVAALVALGLPVVATRPEPLAWLVPAGVALLALAAVWLAPRASGGRGSA